MRTKHFALTAAAVACALAALEAHKPITSKYTYNDDVFPILRDRCAGCHVPGGVAPMSLMTYEEAYPWAESIRAELIAGHMPPWNADPSFGDVRNAHPLSPKELDVILTWASGGNPPGALDQKLPAVTLKNEWPLGAPDITLPLAEPFSFAADKMEDTKEFTVRPGLTEPRWIRAVDLLPGTPSIVRSAVIVVKSAGEPSAAPGSSPTPAPERVLARWVPGRDPETLGDGIAYRLPAGAELAVRVHYKKTWQFEGKVLADRSTVGVYFAKEPADQELLALSVASPTSAVPGTNQRVMFSQTLGDAVQAVAIAPDEVPPNITLQVQAVAPDGSTIPLIRLNTRADWNRRYWFARPVTLPRGARVEVTADLRDPDMYSTAFGPPAAKDTAPRSTNVRLSLNVVPPASRPAAP